MKNIQYRVVNKQTKKLLGYIVGKTTDPATGARFLVLQCGQKRFLQECNPANDKKFEIQVLEVA